MKDLHGGRVVEAKKVRLGSSGAPPLHGIVPEAGADSASNRAEGATEDAAARQKSIEAACKRAPSGVTGETAARAS